MKLSNRGIALLKKLEGFRAEPYRDAGGHLTVGYGHKMRSHEKKEPYTSITLEAAHTLFLLDLGTVEEALTKDTDFVPLTQRQFDALVIFIFNVGITAYRASTLRKCLLAKEYAKVPGELMRWRYITTSGVKVVSKGLALRRAAEAKLWRGEANESV